MNFLQSEKNGERTENGREAVENIKLRTICNLCTKRDFLVNKTLPYAYFAAGYTNFSMVFLHNVQIKELAIIGILM